MKKNKDTNRILEIAGVPELNLGSLTIKEASSKDELFDIQGAIVNAFDQLDNLEEAIDDLDQLMQQMDDLDRNDKDYLKVLGKSVDNARSYLTKFEKKYK